ncbi:DUF7692 domain-containing protein [Halobaculum roseum]|uniref:DUF7692 domain-containing protein n=1 Tax=Halobaculum roseum TaxID=2175149 RepID=UPI003CE4FAAA
MRIRTDGNKSYRTRLYDRAARSWGVATRADAIDKSCRFSSQLIPALAEANSHPDMTDDLREVLSNPIIELTRTTRSEYSVILPNGKEITREQADIQPNK